MDTNGLNFNERSFGEAHGAELNRPPSKPQQDFIAKGHRKQVIKVLKPKLDIGEKETKILLVVQNFNIALKKAVLAISFS